MPKYNKEDESHLTAMAHNVLRGMVDRINEIIQNKKKLAVPMTDDEAQALEDAIFGCNGTRPRTCILTKNFVTSMNRKQFGSLQNKL